jgi:hypothetical protein
MSGYAAVNEALRIAKGQNTLLREVVADLKKKREQEAARPAENNKTKKKVYG